NGWLAIVLLLLVHFKYHVHSSIGNNTGTFEHGHETFFSGFNRIILHGNVGKNKFSVFIGKNSACRGIRRDPCIFYGFVTALVHHNSSDSSQSHIIQSIFTTTNQKEECQKAAKRK